MKKCHSFSISIQGSITVIFERKQNIWELAEKRWLCTLHYREETSDDLYDQFYKKVGKLYVKTETYIL